MSIPACCQLCAAQIVNLIPSLVSGGGSYGAQPQPRSPALTFRLSQFIPFPFNPETVQLLAPLKNGGNSQALLEQGGLGGADAPSVRAVPSSTICSTSKVKWYYPREEGRQSMKRFYLPENKKPRSEKLMPVAPHGPNALTTLCVAEINHHNFRLI